MVAEIQVMRFHGPGWTLELEDRSYWLWAPQDGKIADPHAETWGSSSEPREVWAACWQGDDGLDGDYRKGGSMDEVLAIFPDDDVAGAFRAAVEEVVGDG